MRFLLTAAAIAAALPAPADDLAAAIPANAKLVVMAKSPLRLAEKIEKLALDSGAPPLPNSPAEALKNAFPDGVIDWKRPAALVWMSFDALDDVVVVAAAADPARPLAKLGGKDLDDGVKEVELHGVTMFVLATGGQVIAAKKAEALQAFRKTGHGLAEQLAGTIAEKADAFATFNVPAAAEELNAKLDAGEQLLNGLGEAVPKQSLEQVRVASKMARTLLRELSRFSMALELDDEGATLRKFLDFRTDGELGKTLVKDFAAPPSEPFAGIPDRPMITVAFFDMARMKTAMSAIGKLNTAEIKDAKVVARLGVLNKAMIESVAGSSMWWGLEKQKFAQFQRNVLAPGADGAALVAGTQEAIGLTISAAGVSEQLPGFKMDAKTSKETRAGIEFLRCDMTMEGLPEQAAGLVDKLVGKPISTLAGIAKDGSMLSVLNLDPGEWLKDSSKLTENAAVKSATAKLGDHPLGVMLVDPFGIMEIAKEALPIPLPAHLTTRPKSPAPLLGFSALATKQGVEFRMRYETATGRALSGQAQP